MVNPITPLTYFVIAIGLLFLYFLFIARKKPEVRKEADRLKARDKAKKIEIIAGHPYRIYLFGFLIGIVLLQVFGWLLLNLFGIEWIKFGWVIKAVIGATLLYLVFSVLSGKFAIDSAPRVFVLLVFIALLVGGIFTIETFLPEFFSTTNLFSATDLLSSAQPFNLG